MQEKLLLRVLLPANGTIYEFRVPTTMTSGQVAGLISQILASRERARYESSYDAELMYADGAHAGRLVDRRKTFRSLACGNYVVSGSLLVLV